MKVDLYRLQKHKEYSFIVPTGMDLGDFDQPQKGWLEVYMPYALEKQDVEVDTIVDGSQIASAMEDLRNDNLAVLITIAVNRAEPATEDGID